MVATQIANKTNVNHLRSALLVIGLCSLELQKALAMLAVLDSIRLNSGGLTGNPQALLLKTYDKTADSTRFRP
jgi:hypothetical protein